MLCVEDVKIIHVISFMRRISWVEWKNLIALNAQKENSVQFEDTRNMTFSPIKLSRTTVCDKCNKWPLFKNTSVPICFIVLGENFICFTVPADYIPLYARKDEP